MSDGEVIPGDDEEEAIVRRVRGDRWVDGTLEGLKTSLQLLIWGGKVRIMKGRC